MAKTLIAPRIIAKEKWEAARRLADAAGGFALAYDLLPADADPEVRRILDFARHQGARR